MEGSDDDLTDGEEGGQKKVRLSNIAGQSAWIRMLGRSVIPFHLFSVILVEEALQQNPAHLCQCWAKGTVDARATQS